MKRTPTLGLCLIATCAFFAMTASGALAFENLPHLGKCIAKTPSKFSNSTCLKKVKAETEGKFAWEPLTTTVKFTSKKETGSALIALESAGGKEVSCIEQEEKTPGEYGPGDQIKNVVLELAGCKSTGIGGACTTTGKEVERIVTTKLHGEPGVVKKELKEEKNIDGFDLKAETGETVAEFSCGPAPVVIKGALIYKAVADLKTTTNRPKSVTEIEYVQEKSGKQVPAEYTPNGGGITHAKHELTKETLEGTISGGAVEKWGLSLTSTQRTGTTSLELRQCEKTFECPK
jgi:hypothetical protein